MKEWSNKHGEGVLGIAIGAFLALSSFLVQAITPEILSDTMALSNALAAICIFVGANSIGNHSKRVWLWRMASFIPIILLFVWAWRS